MKIPLVVVLLVAVVLVTLLSTCAASRKRKRIDKSLQRSIASDRTWNGKLRLRTFRSKQKMAATDGDQTSLSPGFHRRRNKHPIFKRKDFRLRKRRKGKHRQKNRRHPIHRATYYRPSTVPEITTEAWPVKIGDIKPTDAHIVDVHTTDDQQNFTNSSSNVLFEGVFALVNTSDDINASSASELDVKNVTDVRPSVTSIDDAKTTSTSSAKVKIPIIKKTIVGGDNSPCASSSDCLPGHCCQTKKNKTSRCKQFRSPAGKKCLDTCMCADGMDCFLRNRRHNGKRRRLRKKGRKQRGMCKIPETDDVIKGIYLKFH